MMELEKGGDIRIIQLGKWQIPKSKEMKTTHEGSYLSMGYFDLINVKSVENDRNVHPLCSAYCGSPRQSVKDDRIQSRKISDNLEEYTIQELMLFTNIGEGGFTETNINDFWENDSLLIFVSLIHIDNNSDINSIIDRIHSTFVGQNYLYYFSFDYSGIVLLAKECTLRCYLELMFAMNYQKNSEDNKLIRDSYSFFGFNKTKLKGYYDLFRNASDYNSINLGIDEGTFSASINIGVQNYNTYKDLIAAVDNTGVKVEKYSLFGRHDVSIVNNHADLKWLIYMQYLLDTFTIKYKDKFDKLFSTHETFVKFDGINGLNDTDNVTDNNAYKTAKLQMNAKCGKFHDKMYEHSSLYNGQYLLPVRAVQCSILSILKNCFAEDFVLCLYQPFLNFLDYLTEKISQEGNVASFEKCYTDFFMCVNSLVNSAMHSERQFIQATAFNAIIYDVPAKIMAFYMAIIDDIQKVMHNPDDKKYTFLLTPSFSDEISVKVISYEDEKLPHDRILCVSINEKSLYNPPEVIRRIAHEIAHFVGHRTRNREERKERIVWSLVHIVLTHLLHPGIIILGDYSGLVDEITKKLLLKKKLSSGKNNYSVELYALPTLIRNEFNKNIDIKNILRNYVKDALKVYFTNYAQRGSDDNQEDYVQIRYLEEYICLVAKKYFGKCDNIFIGTIQNDFKIDFITNMVMKDIEEAVQYINLENKIRYEIGRFDNSFISKLEDRLLSDKTLGDYTKGFISIYSEAFSDIQMVLVTNLSFEEYLKGYCDEEAIDIETFLSDTKDISRVSMVSMILYYLSIWNDIRNYTTDNKSEALKKLHSAIIRDIDAVESLMGNEEYTYLTKQTYRNLAKEFLNKTGTKYVCSEPVERDLKQNTSYDSEGMDMVRAYINLQLLHYLLKCMIDSISMYCETTKIELIKELRHAIIGIKERNDIRKVFSVICEVNNKYKESLFRDN